MDRDRQGDDDGDDDTLALLRRVRADRGAELARRHGAHSVGIGRADDGTSLALVLHVDPAVAPDAEPAPSTLTVLDDGGTPVEVPVRVVVEPPATFE